jgi:hypothetical protein
MALRIDRMTVTLYRDLTNEFINDPDGPVFRDLDRRMTVAQHAAKRFVRVRSGRLLSSIRKRRGVTTRGPYVEIVAGGRTARYALFEEQGTRPHIIRARRRKALRFMQGGQVRFARAVRHPGTRGSHFLTRALPLAGG